MLHPAQAACFQQERMKKGPGICPGLCFCPGSPIYVPAAATAKTGFLMICSTSLNAI
jgi:hypothetical protein